MSGSALLVSSAARSHPGALAVVLRDREICFAELAELVAARVEGLVRAGADAPGLVLGLRPQIELTSLLWIYAALELGQPMVLFHPRLTQAELTEARARVPGLVDVETGTLEPRDERRLPRELAYAAGEERPLALFFTSGTSGRPKLAVLSRRAFEASARMNAERLGWTAVDRWQLSLPLAHVGGLSVITRSLIAKRPIVLPSSSMHFDPELVLSDITRHASTLLSVVPNMLDRLIEHSPSPPASLRVVLVGGAPARTSILERASSAGWPIVCTYGLTETCASVAMTTREGWKRGISGVGRELHGLELELSLGRIRVRGPSLFSGYLEDDRLRSGLDADGWFDTKDLGHRDEHGDLHVDARRTDLILSGGENVYPREIELALEAGPGVREALVVGVPDERWGERPVALLCVGDDYAEASLRSALQQKLARFKLPEAFIVLDELPRTGLGKLDRARGRELARLYLEP